MKFMILGLIFCLAACASNTRNVALTDGWRVADKEDAVDDWARFNSPNKIIDDFNGDGKADIAQILINENSKTGFKLVVEVSGIDKINQFKLVENPEIAAQSTAIELLNPSNEVWESACSKGYWDCEKDEIRQFKITKPSIQFCYIESACTVFLWSDRNKEFIEIPISD